MPTGLRDGETVKCEFHYKIGRYTWYRQNADHWVELGESAYVKRFEVWLLTEEGYAETSLGEGTGCEAVGVKRALRLASEVLEQKRADRDAAVDNNGEG